MDDDKVMSDQARNLLYMNRTWGASGEMEIGTPHALWLLQYFGL